MSRSHYTKPSNPRSGVATSIPVGTAKKPRGGRNAVDMTGLVIGRLTIIKRVFREGVRNSLWLCKCQCGTEKVIGRPNLRSGGTQSCGCLYRESHTRKKPRRNFSLSPGESAKRNILKGYKYSAKAKGLEWSLTGEEFDSLIRQPCAYCGEPPSRLRKVSGNGHFVFNGIDRIDNRAGYISCNVVACCHVCNHAKCDMSLDDFREWIGKAYAKMFGNS